MNYFRKVFYAFAGLAVLSLSYTINLQAMVGGGDATSSQTSGIVALSYEGGFSNCVGVLLEPTRVLTSVSCIDMIGSRISASDIRVHPLSGSEIGGSFLIPTINERVTPFVGVSSFVFHPQNTFSSGPYNLAILKLSAPLNTKLATLYGGDDSFVGSSVQAFGWREEVRSGGFLNLRYFIASILQLPKIVDGDSDFESISNGCYDSFVDTNTVFCAGHRNTSKFLESDDRGAPAYQRIGNKDLVIGLSTRVSRGSEFEGSIDYETFARISSMRSFIETHAPNTQFLSESDLGVKKKGVPSGIFLLLLDD